MNANLKQNHTLSKSYDVEGDSIIFDNGIDLIEASTINVVFDLQKEYPDVEIYNDKLCATQRFEQRGNQDDLFLFDELPIEEIEHAVFKSNYKILQP